MKRRNTPDLDALISRGRGDLANKLMRPVVNPDSACLSASCPSAERNRLTGPTGQSSPAAVFETRTVHRAWPPCRCSFSLERAQWLGPNRAVALNRRRLARDDFLGRALSLAIVTFAAKAPGQAQAPTRKGGRLTLNRCLVQLARGADAVCRKSHRNTRTPPRSTRHGRMDRHPAWHDAARAACGRGQSLPTQKN
jgi:hypothetical protein